MADDEDIAALVIDNGSGMCKGMYIRLPTITKQMGVVIRH